ncbi:hypothetical protein AYX14_07087 [Cryptococcus neoformans]|nr:hypothetical protein AYX14_07087 [Cryptococcus neoformans var. grubii]
MHRSRLLVQGGIRGFASIGRSVLGEIVGKGVVLPFYVFDTKIKILEGTQPAKLAWREVALTMEPLQCKVITINVDQNTVEQRTPVIESVNNRKKLTVVYRVITLGAIEGSRIVGDRLYRVPRSTDTDPCTRTGIRRIGE